MSDAQRTKSGIWSKYSGLSKNARLALGISLIVGGLLVEEQVLQLWDRLDAFQTSIRRSLQEYQEGKRKLYSFYDGPPFATGLPHYGHILAGTIKDTVTRYAHMTGHYVPRRFGWDCHGLPVEYEIDKTEGIRTKQDVLTMGIDVYNEKCRSIVMRYSKEWEKVVKRLGRWIDFERDYKTMDPSFMESVWHVFYKLWEKELVYRGFKVMPYSTGCTTPLSNFEAGQAYKDTIDPAIVVSFPLVNKPDVSLVAWTTTPWTLPSNLALCVNPTLSYVTVLDKASGRKYVLCQDRLPQLYKDERKKKDDEPPAPMPDETAEYKVLERVPGTELVGQHYSPLFDHLTKLDAHYRDVCYVVVSDNFVTSDSGTGIVHCAPTFGEDDYRVCMEHKLIVLDTKGVKYLPQPIDDNGLFRTDGQLPQLDGMYVKDADKKVIELLKQSGRLVQRGQLNHSYPFCWRSDTPLLYRAVPSWFVKVTALKSRLLENNEQTYWVPSFVKEKRFHNWLKDARDWAISRNRFWGTPLPIWVSEDGEEIVVVQSIKDLEEKSGVRGITDLHRHFIDKITIPSQKGKGVLRRVDEVFDCWFESGSMPYAQQHYPFENEELFKQGFPADFIAEGIDQTRGWFYTLLVISTALFDAPPFKNLIVNGLVLAADGKKMSKRLKNYPDPQDVINQYGADALRLYLIDSPVVRADSLRFEEKGVKAIINDVFNRWFNAYRLFVQNVLRLKGGFKYEPSVLTQSANVMDKWVLSSTQSLIQFVSEEMKYYRLYTVVPRLVKYVNQLANVYVRFNRDRFKGKQGQHEQHLALNVLLQVLLTVVRTMAPFAPFFTESMYQNLKHLLPASEQHESVHFCSFPTADTKLMDTKIEDSVQLMLDLIELVRTIRDKKKIASKFPLATLAIIGDVDEQTFHSLERYIKSEANVKEIKLTKDKSSYVQYTPSLNFAALGKRLKGDMPKVKELVSALTREQIQDFQTTGSMTLLGHNLTLNDITFKTSYGGGAGEEEGRWEAATTNSLVTSTSSGELEGEQKNTLPDVLIVLDTLLTEEFIHEGISREVMNRVQRLRKQAELEPHDEAQFFYRVVAGKEQDHVLPALLKYTKDIEAHTNSRLYAHTKQHPLNVRVVESSTAVWGSQFELCMCRPGLVLTDKARAAFGEEFATNLQTLLLTLHYEHSKKQLLSSGQLTLTLDKRTVTLKLDEDVLLHPQH